MYYLYWYEGEFSGGIIRFQGKVGSHQLDLDIQNNLHAYRDASVPVPGGSVTGLYHQCLNTSLTWSTPVALSKYDSVGYGSRASWDGNERMAFGWKEFGSTQLTIVVLDGCQESHRNVVLLPELPDVSSWGNLASIAITDQPGKVCALIEIPYASTEFGLQCADVTW